MSRIIREACRTITAVVIAAMIVSAATFVFWAVTITAG